MTPNMLMVLVDVHRGTLDADRHMGTYHEDVSFLQKSGLIERDRGGVWHTTPKGTAHVERACGPKETKYAFLVWEDSCEAGSQPELTAVYDDPNTVEAYVRAEAKKWTDGRTGLSLTQIDGGPQFDHFELRAPTHHPRHCPTPERRWTVQLFPLS